MPGDGGARAFCVDLKGGAHNPLAVPRHRVSALRPEQHACASQRYAWRQWHSLCYRGQPRSGGRAAFIRFGRGAHRWGYKGKCKRAIKGPRRSARRSAQPLAAARVAGWPRAGCAGADGPPDNAVDLRLFARGALELVKLAVRVVGAPCDRHGRQQQWARLCARRAVALCCAACSGRWPPASACTRGWRQAFEHRAC